MPNRPVLKLEIPSSLLFRTPCRLDEYCGNFATCFDACVGGPHLTPEIRLLDDLTHVALLTCLAHTVQSGVYPTECISHSGGLFILCFGAVSWSNHACRVWGQSQTIGGERARAREGGRRRSQRSRDLRDACTADFKVAF